MLPRPARTRCTRTRTRTRCTSAQAHQQPAFPAGAVDQKPHPAAAPRWRAPARSAGAAPVAVACTAVRGRTAGRQVLPVGRWCRWTFVPSDQTSDQETHRTSVNSLPHPCHNAGRSESLGGEAAALRRAQRGGSATAGMETFESQSSRRGGRVSWMCWGGGRTPLQHCRWGLLLIAMDCATRAGRPASSRGGSASRSG